MENKLNKMFVKRGVRPNERKPPVTSEDPRIDSPEIQVVYPSIEQEVIEQKVVEQPTVLNDIPPVISNNEESNTGTTKLGLQEAIEQNFKSFIIVGLVVFSLGFLIGKVK